MEQILPGASIYNLLQHIVNTRSIPEFVNTASSCSNCEASRFGIYNPPGYLYILPLLVLVLISCKTPEMTELHEEEKTIEQTQTEQRITQGEDTTTIWHHIINDTTTVTHIIRKYKTVEVDTAQSLQKEETKAQDVKTDTITPALISKALKGFTIGCIVVVLILLVFLVVLILVVRWSRNRG